jgi:hypothetical protein
VRALKRKNARNDEAVAVESPDRVCGKVRVVETGQIATEHDANLAAKSKRHQPRFQ